MIKAVCFDAIDTLFAAYPDKIGMYQRIIKETTGLSVDYSRMSEVWDEIIAETEAVAQKEMCGAVPALAWDGFNAKILSKLGYTGDDIEQRGETLRLESWTNPENFSLYPDVRPTLKKLAEQNILIGCISNEAEGLNNFFTHFDIDNYFKAVVISEVFGCEKPNSKIFLAAANDLELKPEEILHIGDSLISDYKGAVNAGLNAVLLDRENNVDDNNITKVNDLTEILNIIKGDFTYAGTTS